MWSQELRGTSLTSVKQLSDPMIKMTSRMTSVTVDLKLPNSSLSPGTVVWGRTEDDNKPLHHSPGSTHRAGVFIQAAVNTEMRY